MRRGARSQTPALLSTVVLGLTLIAAITAAPAASGPQAAAGTLDLRMKVSLTTGPLIVVCTGPLPGPPPWAATGCQARTGTAVVKGLGKVSVSYTWLLGVGPPACELGSAKPLGTVGFLRVAGKGNINFALADGARCLPFDYGAPGRLDWMCEPQDLVINVATGLFAGASGKGKVGRCGSRIPGGLGEWKETWRGTLQVPGMKFDLTAPKLRVPGSKIVRAENGAKSAPVSFKVTARDDVDGAVRASCRPRSGTRFKIGVTTVRCTATDSSGNTDRAAFKVTVTQ